MGAIRRIHLMIWKILCCLSINAHYETVDCKVKKRRNTSAIENLFFVLLCVSAFHCLLLLLAKKMHYRLKRKECTLAKDT